MPFIFSEVSREGWNQPQMPLSCQKRQMALTVKISGTTKDITMKILPDVAIYNITCLVCKLQSKISNF